jgi:uncharacterized membrane protein YciS (DUF1049 family)
MEFWNLVFRSGWTFSGFIFILFSIGHIINVIISNIMKINHLKKGVKNYED